MTVGSYALNLPPFSAFISWMVLKLEVTDPWRTHYFYMECRSNSASLQDKGTELRR